VQPVPQLKDFLAWLPDEPAREACAAACGVSLGHLRNVMYGLRKLEPKACVALESQSAASPHRVRRWHLWPEDWHEAWPELIGTEGAPDPALAAQDEGERAA
jgi:hypothetical protein